MHKTTAIAEVSSVKALLRSTVLLVCGFVGTATAIAGDRDHDEFDTVRPFTIAVFGDWPYNQRLLDNAALLISSVNADRDMSLMIHVGDIHSGRAVLQRPSDELPVEESEKLGSGLYFLHSYSRKYRPDPNLSSRR
jgi:hypothetical protein